MTRLNCARDWIAVDELPQPTRLAGFIRTASADATVDVMTGRSPDGMEKWERRSARWAITLNVSHGPATKYATLVHELAHLYCGHLGTPNKKWWPDRSHVEEPKRELRAESILWLVCERCGIENPSARYLDGYLNEQREVPSMTIKLVLKVAGHIERMGARS